MMNNKNHVTEPITSISSTNAHKMMAEPSDDEILAAQALLELSKEIRRFYDEIVSVLTLKHNHQY